MVRKKGVFPILLFTLLILSISACSTERNKTPQPQGEKEGRKVKIGFSMATLQEERWQRDRDIFVAKAKELGADIIVQNANNDSEEQAQQVKYLLEKGIDVLVIVPQDAEKAAALVQMAKKNNVKVIAYDRLVRNANVDLYISFDNVTVGRLMAESLTQKAPRGNYMIINGARTDYNCYLFNEGYKSVLKDYIARGDIRVIEEVWARDWMHEDAYRCIEDTLRKGFGIDAVIAANDSLASAVIEVLSENRLAGKVLVAGHDADLSGCQRVVEGTQLVTVYKPIDRIAKTAAEMAVRMAAGEQLKSNSMIHDGKYDVPYYIIQPKAITKENMRETIIADSFHRFEDVYRNIPKSQWPEN